MITKSAWAVFDPRGVAGAERLLVPRIPDLEGMRTSACSTIRSGAPTACCA